MFGLATNPNLADTKNDQLSQKIPDNMFRT